MQPLSLRPQHTAKVPQAYQHLLSRKMAVPAGQGQTVDVFIAWGSSHSMGIGCCQWWLPGILARPTKAQVP